MPWLRNCSYWVVKTSPMAPGVEQLLRAEIHNVDGNVAVGRVQPMREVMADALATRRFNLFLVGCFAVAALFLAAAGLFAVSPTESNNEPARSACGSPSARRTAVS